MYVIYLTKSCLILPSIYTNADLTFRYSWLCENKTKQNKKQTNNNNNNNNKNIKNLEPHFRKFQKFSFLMLKGLYTPEILQWTIMPNDIAQKNEV